MVQVAASFFHSRDARKGKQGKVLESHRSTWARGHTIHRASARACWAPRPSSTTWALLRAEVATQAQRLSSGSHAEATAARQVLEVLRRLPVLTGVRTPAGLANLPEPERQTWRALWQEVEGLLRGPAPAR
jgi:hypothetical protein